MSRAPSASASLPLARLKSITMHMQRPSIDLSLTPHIRRLYLRQVVRLPKDSGPGGGYDNASSLLRSSLLPCHLYSHSLNCGEPLVFPPNELLLQRLDAPGRLSCTAVGEWISR